MLHYIQQIKSINDDFSLICLFNTNELRRIDLSGWVADFKNVNDGWASRISDINYFRQVQLDSYGTLKWENELDFCPDVLYAMSEAVK